MIDEIFGPSFERRPALGVEVVGLRQHLEGLLGSRKRKSSTGSAALLLQHVVKSGKSPRPVEQDLDGWVD